MNKERALQWRDKVVRLHPTQIDWMTFGDAASGAACPIGHLYRLARPHVPWERMGYTIVSAMWLDVPETVLLNIALPGRSASGNIVNLYTIPALPPEKQHELAIGIIDNFIENDGRSVDWPGVWEKTGCAAIIADIGLIDHGPEISPG